MRFCSRCGFPLTGVTDLLNQGGAQSAAAAPPSEQQMTPRRKGIKQGVTMMFIGAVLVPVLAVLATFTVGPSVLEILVPLTAVICFAGGLMRILYAVFFEENNAVTQPSAPGNVSTAYSSELNAGARVSALPPPQSRPAADFLQRRANTAELVPPPSVTENTTKLLDDDKTRRLE